MPGAGQDRHQFGLVFKLQENFLKTALSNERRESLGNTGAFGTGEDVHKTQLTDAHLCPGPQCQTVRATWLDWDVVWCIVTGVVWVCRLRVV